MGGQKSKREDMGNGKRCTHFPNPYYNILKINKGKITIWITYSNNISLNKQAKETGYNQDHVSCSVINVFTDEP